MKPSRPKSQPAKIDISVNVTAHHEGILLHKTLRSIWAGIKVVQAKDLNVEFNLTLDNPDEETKRVVQHFADSYKKAQLNVFEIDKGDLGLSRNYLIEKSHGTYVAFFDGDDFFTENYLAEAFSVAEAHGEPAVYSPTYMINFEGDHYLIIKQDSYSKEFSPANIFETNYFISQSFVHRDIYKKVTYKPNGNGYGMEDWLWNSEVLAAGFKFVNVPGTIFFYRRKRSGGLLAGQVSSNAVLRPSKLFLPAEFSKLPKPKKLPPPPNPVTTLEGGRPAGGIASTSKKILGRYPKAYKYARAQFQLHRSVYSVMLKRFGIEKRRKQDAIIIEDMTTIIPDVPDRVLKIGFDKEVMRQWGMLNQYEPMIRASQDQPLYIPIVEYPTQSALSELYYEFCKKYGTKIITDIVLVPHIERGGADLAAINLIKEIAKRNGVLVVTTIDVESPWAGHVEKLKNVICLESKYAFTELNEDQRLMFLLRVIQHWKVKRISIVNSEVGYKLVTRYTRAIKGVGCKTFLHTYAFDMTDDGYLFNYVMNGLVDAYEGVDYFVTDSLGYKKQLEEINGFDPKKVVPLYLPAANHIIPKQQYDTRHKIVWASRVHNSKLIDVAVEVGRQLEPHGIALHMYGALGDEYAVNDKFLRMIKPYGNIVYHGSYEKFGAIPMDDYDMFLMTSKNEGMPNVILEAMMANIFIVAPAVGGVPECIANGHNGVLVDNKFDPRAYLDAILASYENHQHENHEAINNQNEKVLQRHSYANYERQVTDLLMTSGD